MSGGFWAGSVPPWASVILVLVCGLVFVLGLAAGESMGRRHELQDRAEERAEREADEFLEQLRPLPEPTHWRQVDHQRQGKASTAAFLDPAGSPFAAAMTAAAATGWEAHCDQAERIANGGPIDTGEIRAITEDMDVFLGRLLAAHPVPWPDGGDQ